MSMIDDTAPAAETDNAATRPLSELLSRQTEDAHHPIEQVAETPAPAAAPAPAPTPEPTPAPAAPKAETPPNPPADPTQTGPKWYREHIAKTNRELAEARAELNRRAGAPAAPAPPTPGPGLPNPAEDPQGYHDAITRNWQSQMQQFTLQTTLNLSERFARQQHGNDGFEDCRTWLTTKPDIEAWAVQQPDPWAAAFQQFQREKIAEEIGDDPAAYRARIEEQIRQEYEAKMEAQRGSHIPAPAPQMRSAPPAPASTVRSTAPRDEAGRYTAPAPLSATTKHRF